MSILHPPVDDPQSGELPCERWNPTQNVRTILLSVVSTAVVQYPYVRSVDYTVDTVCTLVC